MSHVLVSLALAIGLTTGDSAELRRQDLMTALRAGGYTVILRHARTDRSFQEERGYVPKERSAQRNLTDEGVRDAQLMGVVFRKYGITFAEIIASPMFRTVETAEMAAGKPTTTMALRTFPSSPDQAALIATPPKPGTNRLLVTHHFVIETHVPGIKPGDIGESEAVVVRLAGDGTVRLVGRILLDDWRALANPTQAAASTEVSGAAAHTATIGGHGGVSPSGSATVAAPATDIPDTHAGHLAREYITAFNTGSTDRMRAFIESSMAANPDRSIEQRLESYSKLYREHGTLSLYTVESSTATEVTLGMRSRRGTMHLTVKSSDAQPMRVSSVTFKWNEDIPGHP